MDDEEWNSGSGRYPECGAIFMSNCATKKECLRRGVFALPSSKFHFVEQIKTGMILFLFEFERKELHGVFQATCDGAMNILPFKFSSSGKEFPAQIKFTPLWNCHPLSEKEFRDAIRENYFSKYKFHFGLSKNQVERLLSLFSLRKLKDQKPQRQLSRSEVPSPNRNTTRKISRLYDDDDHDRSPMTNRVPGEFGVDKNHRQVISTQQQRDHFCDEYIATDDGRFGVYRGVGDEHKVRELLWNRMGKVGCTTEAGERATSDQEGIEKNTGIDLRASALFGYPLGNFGSTPDSLMFAKNDRLETECYKDDNGFATTIPEACTNSFQSKVNSIAYSSKPVQETDITRLPSMERQSSKVGYLRTSCEDSIVIPTLPYNPDVPSMNYNGSSSLGFYKAPTKLQEFSNHDSFAAGNILPSPKAQPFSSPLETKRPIIIPDSGLPYPSQYKYSNRTNLPRHLYSDDIADAYSKEECSGGLSLQKHSAHVSSEMINYAGMSEHPLTYGGSPSNHWSLLFSDGHPTSLQEKHDRQVPVCENNAEFTDNAFMFKESEHHGDSFYNYKRVIEDGRLAPYENMEYEHKKSLHQLYVQDPANLDNHGVTSLSPAACRNSECLNPDYQKTSLSPTAAYQNSECLNPDPQKKRSSVFSRLALPSKACKQERKTTPGTAAAINENSSVNEVMDMLHRSKYSWMKARPKQSSMRHDDVSKSKDKKQATEEDDLGMIEEMYLKQPSSIQPLPFRMEEGCQKAAKATFVDFKRRSLMKKKLEDGKTGNNHENLENKGASAPQSKRRKLIRPNFSENESTERVLSGDAPQNVIASSSVCSVSKDAESIKISASHVKDDGKLQNVELLNGICETAVEGNNNNIDKGSDSSSEQFRMESSMVVKSSDEGGKESSQNDGILSMTKIEQDSSTRNVRVDGLTEVSHSTLESFPKVCEDVDNNGVAKSKYLYKIELINDLCPAGGKISISNAK